MSDRVNQIREALDWFERINAPLPADTKLHTVARAARSVAEGTELRYCLWHERRAADDSGDEDSGTIITRFCSSQDGSHDCEIVSRRLVEWEDTDG